MEEISIGLGERVSQFSEKLTWCGCEMTDILIKTERMNLAGSSAPCSDG